MSDFESDIISIFYKYLDANILKMQNIENCHNIAENFKNKIIANELNDKFHKIIMRDDFTRVINNVFKVVKYEFLINEHTKDNIKNITLLCDDNNLHISYANNETYSDNGKIKYMYHKIFINDNLIIKKESHNLRKLFLNFTYLDEIINIAKIDIKNVEFLEMIISLFSLNSVFENLTQEVKNNVIRTYYDKNWSSDSEVSMSDND